LRLWKKTGLMILIFGLLRALTTGLHQDHQQPNDYPRS